SRNAERDEAREAQPDQRAVDRNVGKEFSGMEAHVDDAGMGGLAEDDQSQIARVWYQHAFVHEQRIGLPGPARRRSRQMVDATFLERCRPRYLAAQVEVAIDQQPGIRIIDDLRAALLEVSVARSVVVRNGHAAPKAA